MMVSENKMGISLIMNDECLMTSKCVCVCVCVCAHAPHSRIYVLKITLNCVDMQQHEQRAAVVIFYTYISKISHLSIDTI
jgi:hypothetical protein